jgi:TonB family protein
MSKHPQLLGLLLSVIWHAGLAVLLTQPLFLFKPRPADAPAPVMMVLTAPPPAPEPPPPAPTPPAEPPPPPQALAPADLPSPDQKAPATQEAPPAPSAEDWAFAGRYTLKNSKGYRHNWGRQVRSMMGTAVEGPDQGMVRFRIEIAPDGTVARVDTLWSTSALAEQKAREAIRHLPTLPPTPTGKPLVFEKTISFSPFAGDDTPLYRHDCDPDVPAFKNPFTWDGQSAKTRDDDPPPPKPMTPEELEACRKQLPDETVQSESARDQRVLDRWGSSKSGAGR